jgi:HAD superfamily hydrolase (TIGR01509 family)
MRCDAVFFDLYGTLLIYGDMTAAWSAWLAALHAWLEEAGVTLERHDLAERCQGFFSWPAPSRTADELTLYEQRLDEFARGLGLAATSDQLRNCAGATIGAWQEYVELDPEALPVLDRLSRTHSLALVSNFDHPPHVSRLLEQTGLERHLPVVVVSGDVGFKKPDPRIFDTAIEAVDLPPDRIAYVGDAPEDILAADGAGMKPVRLQRDGDTEGDRAADFRHSPTPRAWAEKIDYTTINSLNELSTWVTRE